MRLSAATPRFLTPSRPAAERELQAVREEAARQMAGPTGGAAAAAAPAEGLSGALSHLFGAARGLFGGSSAAGHFGGTLSGLLDSLQSGASALTRSLGGLLGGLTPQSNWETGLPPVGAAPQPIAPPKGPRKGPEGPGPFRGPLPANGAAEALKRLTPEQLAALGKTDKAGFFAALRPAAEEAERTYGVPASVILAQAALETGWGAHIIPGYNLFGHKGTGPAGTVTKRTWEVINGETVWIDAGFAKYHNFYEAVAYAGKRYHNGYYDKAVTNYAKYHDPERFARDITGIYATDPAYGDKLISIMRQYKLNG